MFDTKFTFLKLLSGNMEDQVLPKGRELGPMVNNLTGMTGASPSRAHGDEAGPQGEIRPCEGNQSQCLPPESDIALGWLDGAIGDSPRPGRDASPWHDSAMYLIPTQVKITLSRVEQLKYKVESLYKCVSPCPSLYYAHRHDTGRSQLLRRNMWVETSSSLLLFSKFFLFVVQFSWATYTRRPPELVWLTQETFVLSLLTRGQSYTAGWFTQLMQPFIWNGGDLLVPFVLSSAFFTISVVSHSIRSSLTCLGGTEFLLKLHSRRAG